MQDGAGATDRVRHRSGNRKEIERLIVDSAEIAFADAGFKGASMQQIADRAGLPKATLHYYCATKEALYRRVVERIFRVWLDAAESFDRSDDPAAALAAYVSAKMDISRAHPHGSKVWAAEIMHGAPIVQDFLEGELRDWIEGRERVIRRWVSAGRIAPIEPRNLLYMIWATTQHYADFQHQIETLNGGAPMSDAQWTAAKHDVIGVVLRGIGLTPPASAGLRATVDVGVTADASTRGEVRDTCPRR